MIHKRLAAGMLLATATMGCATATPRFSPDVQAGLARDDMRKLETPDARIYYAEHEREEALRVAGRLQACIEAIRKHAKVKAPGEDDKANIVLPSVPFNNAYVQSGASGQQHIAVVPTFETTDMFALFGISPDPSMIGCHEMVHYVQTRQLSGLPRVGEAIFGYLYPPEGGLEPWFWEGLAVYYETRLQGGRGRLGSAYWTGSFAAGVAEDGPRESDLDFANRRIPWGGQYLVGSHFVDWLVKKYGEPKLWDVIARQSDEVLFPIDVSGRFRNAFGSPLANLYAEFARETKAAIRKRVRPATQAIERTLDQYARLAVAKNGTWAAVESGIVTQSRIVVVGADGVEKFSTNLTGVLPSRALVAPSALMVSGLSFTDDGRELWFVAVDQGRTFQVTRLCRVDVATGALTVVAEDLGGAGGGISPEGDRFWFSYVRGDSWELAYFDTRTRRIERLANYGPRVFITSPRISPDGQRIVATFVTDDAVEVRIVDARTGAFVSRVHDQGVSMDATWVANDTLVYAAERAGRFQIHRARFASGAKSPIVTALTDAPHLATSPVASGRRVVFLNREGWHWSVDSVPLDGDAADAADANNDAVPPSHARAHAERVGDAPVKILSDKPYTQTDGLFVPTGRGPRFAANGVTVNLGFVLGGGDRLGFHRWAMGGGWDFQAKEPSAQLSYVNAQLAPVLLRLDLARFADHEQFGVPTAIAADGILRGTRRETTAYALMSRTFWTTTITSGVRYESTELTVPLISTVRHAAGSFTSLGYAAVETTPGAGIRRGLEVFISGTFFPGLTTPAFGDTRAAVRGTVPLPFSRYHTLALNVVGRAFPGLRSFDMPLSIGGGISRLSLSDEANTTMNATSNDLSVALRFQEPLRGFEDFALYGRFLTKGELVYRYPLLIDRGTISTASVFGSFLMRGIDFEAFGTGASLWDDRPLAIAAGGAVVGRFKLWVIPFDLGVQVAQRFSYDERTSFTLVGSSR